MRRSWLVSNVTPGCPGTENGRFNVASVIESTGARCLAIGTYSATCLDDPLQNDLLPGGRSKWDPYDSFSLRVVCPYCGNAKTLTFSTTRRILLYAAEDWNRYRGNGKELKGKSIFHAPTQVRMDYAIVAGTSIWVPYLYFECNITKELVVLRADADMWCWKCDGEFRWIIPHLWGKDTVTVG